MSRVRRALLVGGSLLALIGCSREDVASIEAARAEAEARAARAEAQAAEAKARAAEAEARVAQAEARAIQAEAAAKLAASKRGNEVKPRDQEPNARVGEERWYAALKDSVQVGDLEWRIASVRLKNAGMYMEVEVRNLSKTNIRSVSTYRLLVKDEWGNDYGSGGISSWVQLYPGKTYKNDWYLRAPVDAAKELKIEIVGVGSQDRFARFVMPRALIE